MDSNAKVPGPALSHLAPPSQGRGKEPLDLREQLRYALEELRNGQALLEQLGAFLVDGGPVPTTTVEPPVALRLGHPESVLGIANEVVLAVLALDAVLHRVRNAV